MRTRAFDHGEARPSLGVTLENLVIRKETRARRALEAKLETSRLVVWPTPRSPVGKGRREGKAEKRLPART